MRLYKRTFGDSDDYVRLFFERRFVADQAMVAIYNGNIASMLFALPIDIVSGSRVYSARYIYAVATDPDYRLLGLSSMLLEKTHQELSDNKVELSLLVPASQSLFSYYERRGYKTQFYINTEIYNSKNASSVRWRQHRWLRWRPCANITFPKVLCSADGMNFHWSFRTPKRSCLAERRFISDSPAKGTPFATLPKALCL
jgi:ribosomal protein S18 acetylase RimI-like enzyme